MSVTPNAKRLFGLVQLLFEIRSLKVKGFLKYINLANTLI